MSGPIDYNALYGTRSPQYQEETKAFQQGVSGFLDQFNAAQAQRLGQRAPVPTPQGAPIAPASAAWTDEDLVGAATYWGLDETQARAMPRDAVIAFVNSQRGASRSMGVSRTAEVLAPIAQFGVGAAEAITGGIQHIPGIGDWLSKQAIVHQADQKVRQLEEGVRASTPQGEQGLESAANIAGNLASMFYPASAAWAVAGKVGEAMPLVSRASAIGRAAFKGGLSAYMLAGGTHDTDEHPWEHRAEVAAIGAGMGILGPIAGKLVQRVTNAYVAPELLGPGDLAGIGAPGEAAIPGNLEHAPGAPTPQAPNLPPGVAELAAQGDPQAQAFLEYMHGGQQASAPATGGPPPDVLAQMPSEISGALQREGDFAPQQGMAAEQPSFGPRVGLGRGPTAGPVAGLAPDISPFAPAEGGSPAGTPFEDWMPRVGLMRGPGPQIPRVGRAVDQAAALAAQMNKVATVVQSSEFPAIAGQTQLTDLSVAQAAHAENPGGMNIVQGIADPVAMIQNLPTNARFARVGNRLDVIFGDEVSDRSALEYERSGVFSGQRVLSSDGIAGTVRAIDFEGGAYIEPIHTGSMMHRNVDSLHPWLTSPQVQEAPDLWNAFQNYTDVRAAETQSAMGGAMRPAQVEAVKTANLASWMEDFFDATGLTHAGSRDRVRQYFNIRYVDSFKAEAPAEMAQQNTAFAELQTAIAENPIQPTAHIDQHAATKGFVAVPTGGDGWTLIDQVGETGQRSQLSFGSQDAAETWLKQVNRELPDITPGTSVPAELAAVHPTVPTQIPNDNLAHHEGIAAQVEHLEAQGGGPLGPPPAALATSGENYGELTNRIQAATHALQPMRRAASAVDEVLHQVTGQDMGLAAGYDNVGVSINQMRQQLKPFQDEYAQLIAPVKRARRISGEWARAYEELDPAKRAAFVAEKGWGEKEIASLDAYDTLMQRMFPETSLDEIRQIPRYFSHIAQRQSVPATFSRAFDDFHLGPTTQQFWEYARTGNLNLREMDPDIVADQYMRSVMWSKHVKPVYDGEVEKWTSLGRDNPDLQDASNFMLNWLDMVKGGYHPKNDLVTKGAQFALKKLVDPSITEDQAKELLMEGMNSSYAGLIGYRPNMVARHFLQMTYAIPRAGSNMVSVLGRAVSGGMSDILATASRDGAVSPRVFTRNAPGAFTGEMERVGAGFGGSGPFPVEHTARFNALSKIYNSFTDLLPDALKSESDSVLKPMAMFSRAIERFRSIVYVAGKEKAAAALAEFRTQGAQGDLDKLMGASSMRTYDPSWQRQFQNLVASGDDETAARFAGRQLIDATFFKYGTAESPEIGKTMTGKVALQLGHYELNYLQFLRESLTNGTKMDRVKTLATMGVVTAGLEAASRETGWNFRWLNPYFAVGFGGGPMLGLAVAAGSGIMHSVKAAEGEDPSNFDLGTQGLTQAAGSGWGMLTPFGGLQRDAAAIGGAIQSPSPGQAITRYMITGETGPGPDINAALLPQAQEHFQQSLQPHQSPVRGGSVYGLPQGMIPPQNVVDPAQLQDVHNIPLTAPTAPPEQIRGAGVAPGGIETFPRVLPQIPRR